jgi:hypothetical protein
LLFPVPAVSTTFPYCAPDGVNDPQFLPPTSRL